jgi:Zn-dependent peptidase ImmA (M78 family)/transcriptional regulator with XRE-family HTH domain
MVEVFNAHLLRLARQYRGLSLRDVVAKFSEIGFAADISTVSRAENGVTAPSKEFVAAAAKVLDFPRDYFFLPDHFNGWPVSVHPMWRKRASTPQKAMDRVLAEFNLRIIHLRRLLRAVEFSAVAPLPFMPVDEYDGDVERIAALVRRTWLLPSGPLADLTTCVERSGCVVVHVDLSDVSVDGVTLNLPDCPPCIFINRSQPADRMRWTLAHELGHVIMHRVPNPEMEDQANVFARFLLMPRLDIKAHFSARRIDLAWLAALKPEWRVSMQALLYHAQALGYISKTQAERLWRQFNKYKIKMREPAELDFPPEQPSLLPRLLGVHLNDFRYSIADLAQILATSQADVAALYNLNVVSLQTPPLGQSPRILRVVS